jgi:hypothetical protein
MTAPHPHKPEENLKPHRISGETTSNPAPRQPRPAFRASRPALRSTEPVRTRLSAQALSREGLTVGVSRSRWNELTIAIAPVGSKERSD